MIHYVWRSLCVMLRAWWEPAGNIDDESVIYLRAWLRDIDTNLHMNNSRYLSVMDFGRVHQWTRAGLARQMIKRGCVPLVSVSMMRHFKSVQYFQVMEVRTKTVGWDEKWFYFEQRVLVAGQLMALGMIKGLISQKGRKVPTAEVLGWIGKEKAKKKIPAYLKEMDKTETAAIKMLKQESKKA